MPCPINIFLSTLSLRRATVERGINVPPVESISIHALLAESDTLQAHPPARHPAFLSTLSLRRATLLGLHVRSHNIHFYPRSPCGERLPTNGAYTLDDAFLSTLSLRRATISEATKQAQVEDFYPRSPCGERPIIRSAISTDNIISIHALLAESDVCYQQTAYFF